MKNINEVIITDTKWLFHFLKEKHLMKQYYLKLYNIEDKFIKPFNFNKILEFNLELKNEYINNYEYLTENQRFKRLLIVNDNLLINSNLFANWCGKPFVLSIRYNLENLNSTKQLVELNQWHDICKKYTEYKNILEKII